MRSLICPVVLVLVLLAAVATAAEPVTFGGSEVTVVTARGRFVFTVEVAATGAERQMGLQHRRQLPPSAGMLFDYGTPQPAAMWMKNTYLPLDMLFIGADGRVVNIAENTVPLSLTTILSRGAVRGVLELNAGTAARLGIRPGDRVLHPIFAGGG